MIYKRFDIGLAFLFSVGFALGPHFASAAVLTLQPSSGVFAVGGTFNVQIWLDSEGQTVNALDVRLLFPADKLQVVSPAVGTSIINVWAIPPRFNNQRGTITLQGGIVEGISASKSLVLTITFRIRETGFASLRFDDETKVLLADGKGTNVLSQAQGGLYNLVLPAPAGPEVVSETHPDQTQWYANSTVTLHWTSPVALKGFSYNLNEQPVFIPDDIVDSNQNFVIYRNLASGVHYFHIKAMNQNDVWGGVTHFAVKVDAEPPADFSIILNQGSRTTKNEIMFSWKTTDAHSGIERYEYKIVALTPLSFEETPFFIESDSPQVVNLERGTYDIIVRAYDKTGNFRETQERVRVMSPFVFWATNIYLLSGLALLLLVLSFAARKVWLRHREIQQKMHAKELPGFINEKLRELEKYKNKYGQLVLLLVLFFGLLFSLTPWVQAQVSELGPPFVSTFPRQISNNEIFYIGGRTEVAAAEVIIYMQNLRTGETFSYSEISGRNGEWFYRHPSFLSEGEYSIWMQSKLGETTSPPSPQYTLMVNPMAIQLGSSRISYETLYAVFAVVLFLALVSLTLFTVAYGKKAKRLRKQLLKEIYEAENAVRRGFDDLRRDIEVELALMRKTKLSKSLSDEEKQREKHLLEDLAKIEMYISKEVEDIERTI